MFSAVGCILPLVQSHTLAADIPNCLAKALLERLFSISKSESLFANTFFTITIVRKIKQKILDVRHIERYNKFMEWEIFITLFEKVLHDNTLTK